LFHNLGSTELTFQSLFKTFGYGTIVFLKRYIVKTGLGLLCLIACGCLFFACVTGPAIRPAFDSNNRIPNCYYFNGHTYIFVDNPSYWHPAKQRCEETGGYLVILDDTDEYTAMTTICAGTTWIGLTDEEVEGRFVWVDGTRLKYPHWASGEPNNGRDCVFYPENYVCLWERADYLWNDAATVSANHFICEYDFLVEDPALLARLRDYLNGKTDIKVLAKESVKTRLVKTLEAMTSDLPKGSVNIQQTATGVRISLADLKFNADSTEIREAEKSKLAVLHRLLAPFRDHTVLFVGHSAQWGSVDSCLELSRKRAQAIAAIFTADGTLRKEKVKTDGRGFFEPLADNATEEGMNKNRRVEILILDQ
jgi:outer membrane protein OmpA-like peptidoglycan-associated protein